MNIYLIRHGEAEKTSEEKPHKERELTVDGIQVVNAAAELWKNYISVFEMIFSSPLKRAMQTALIIKEVFKIKTEVLEEVSLMNGGLTEDLLNIVSAFGVEDVAMIGHQPDMGIHISRMTSPAEVNIKIPPATLAKISFNGNPGIGRGKLELLFPPVIKKG